MAPNNDFVRVISSNYNTGVDASTRVRRVKQVADSKTSTQSLENPTKTFRKERNSRRSLHDLVETHAG